MIDYSIKKQTVTWKEDGTEKTGEKYYATAQARKTYDINEFARHISNHGSTLNRADIVAVLIQTVDCMKELLLDGNSVQLGELGKFYLTLSSDGAESYSKFSANNIKNVRIAFSAGKDFDDIRSDAEFNHVGTRKQQKDNIKAEPTDEDNNNSNTPTPTPNPGGGDDNGGVF